MRLLPRVAVALLAHVLFLAAPSNAQFIAARVPDGSTMAIEPGTDWTTLPGRIQDGPDACSPDGGATVYMAMRGLDNAIWVMERRSGVWANLRSIGGDVASGPAVVCPGGGALHVFVRGLDGALWRNVVNGAAEMGWWPLGGRILDEPDAVAWGDSAVLVVARGEDNGVLGFEIEGVSTTPVITRHGGAITSGPSVAGPAPGGGRTTVNTYIFARGPNQGLFWGQYQGRGPIVWNEDRQGQLGGAPDATWDGSGYQIAIRGTDDAVYTGRLADNRFSGWSRMDSMIASDPTIVFTSPRPAISATAPSGRYRIEITGFRVNRQTHDDALNRDGWGDEVFLAPYVIHFTSDGAPVLQPRFVSPVMGERQGHVTVRAGRGGADGGLQTSNTFPADPTGPRLDGQFSLLFEGELRSGHSGVAILPSIWESDNDRRLLSSFDRSFTAFSGHVADGLRRRLTETIGQTAGIPVVRTARDLGVDFVALQWDGSPGDYPIGVTHSSISNSMVYRPRLMVITYEVAEMITNSIVDDISVAESGDIGRSTHTGAVPGIFAMRLRDSAPFQGDYTVFLRITRIG